MATPNRPLSQNKYPEQYMGNTSFDEDFAVNAVETLGFDGKNLQRQGATSYAIKMTVDGNVTYIGLAAPGTSQSDATWQAMKLDMSSGILLTWADGNCNYDNNVTNLTGLNYS